MPVECAARLEGIAVPGLPVFAPGDDIGVLAVRALSDAAIELRDGDVLVVASKALSRAQGRFVDLATVEARPAARTLARETSKDERIVELILRESIAVSRVARDVLIVRHRLGFVCANAGIDQSNAQPPGAPASSGPWVLLLPEAPDRAAATLRDIFAEASGARIGVVVSDSFGRPFRVGTVGMAIGVAGLPPLWDRRGEPDLFGRRLEQTVTALGDQVAAVADLVAGQAAEGRALVVVRGLAFEPGDYSADELLRPANKDLYF